MTSTISCRTRKNNAPTTSSLHRHMRHEATASPPSPDAAAATCHRTPPHTAARRLRTPPSPHTAAVVTAAAGQGPAPECQYSPASPFTDWQQMIIPARRRCTPPSPPMPAAVRRTPHAVERRRTPPPHAVVNTAVAGRGSAPECQYSPASPRSATDDHPVLVHTF